MSSETGKAPLQVCSRTQRSLSQLHGRSPAAGVSDPEWYARRAPVLTPVAVVKVHNILVGKNGTVIGEIGKRARIELELLFQRRVHLYLHVKTASS